MIKVTRSNGEEIVVNAGLIEFVEATPDTMIALTTGRKIRVKETVAQVVERVADYESWIGSSGRYGRRFSSPDERESFHDALHEALEESG